MPGFGSEGVRAGSERRSQAGAPSAGWDLASLVQLFSNRQLRLGDVAGISYLAEQLIQNPDDVYLQDVLTRVVEEQAAAALLSGDPFHGNSPPLGVLPAFGPGRAPMLQLPSSDVLSENLMSPRNILIVGPTGQGKTTWSHLFFLSVIAAPPCLVVAFDRKRGELIDCESLARPGLPVLVLHWRELQIAMLQPVMGIEVPSFVNTMVQLLARESHLFASRRLMLDTLAPLYRKVRAHGTWPTLSEWFNVLDLLRVSAASRMGQYREAAMFALRQVLIELGEVVNYAASDMLDRLFARQGVVVIITEGLSSPMQALLASVFLNYAYLLRQPARELDELPPLYCLLDDALPLAYGSATSEAEGGISPLAEWCFMGRSRRMALVVSAQNFSLLSPALRTNSHVIICVGSYGRDAEELSRHMSLTREQAERLPFLTPGEAVARVAPWPAMYGRIPKVP